MTKEELKQEAEEYTETKGKEHFRKFYNSDKNIAELITQVYIDCAEPREKRIEELEYQLTHRNCLDCSNHSSNLRMRNLELEKENAELKTKVTALENANRAMVKELDDTTSGGLSVLENVVRSKEQLTTAKELLKQWLQTSKNNSCDNINIVSDTEQFLSEVEK